jgi:hypothetical protein
MILSAHQPHYLPWLGFFDKIARSDAFVYLDCVQFVTREFQNRNKIRTCDGDMWLTVPVITKGKGHQPIGEVSIDNSLPWPRQHLHSLRTWYGSAPFFKDHVAFFEAAYANHWDKLVDLNMHITGFFLEQLRIKTPVHRESQCGTSKTKTERIIELCKSLRADTYLSGAGGRNYLDEGLFAEKGIKLVYQEFVHPHYHQQFMKDGGGFIPYMSIADLFFNEGNNSRKILELE